MTALAVSLDGSAIRMLKLGLVFTFATLTLFLAGCGFFLQQHILFVQMSPDQRYVATVYQDSWGPPPRHGTYVNVRSSESRFRGRDHDAIFAIDDQCAVGVLWTDNSHLRIVCISCPGATVQKQEKTWRDVVISFESYKPSG